MSFFNKKEKEAKETFSFFQKEIPFRNATDNSKLKELIEQKHPTIFTNWTEICKDVEKQYSYLVNIHEVPKTFFYKREVRSDNKIIHIFEDDMHTYRFMFNDNYKIETNVFNYNFNKRFFWKKKSEKNTICQYNYQIEVSFGLHGSMSFKGHGIAYEDFFVTEKKFFKILQLNERTVTKEMLNSIGTIISNRKNSIPMNIKINNEKNENNEVHEGKEINKSDIILNFEINDDEDNKIKKELIKKWRKHFIEEKIDDYFFINILGKVIH